MAFKKGHMAWLGELAARRKSQRGEDNISYNPELAALAEGPEVFEAGYVDPRAKNYEAKLPTPPVSAAPAVVAPIVAAQDFAKNYQTNLESDPEYQKLQEINEIDSLIEQGLGKSQEIFNKRTGEGPLPSEEVPPVPMPIVGEVSPANDLEAYINNNNKQKASQLTDVLKEMNKTVKMMMPQFDPKGDKYNYKDAKEKGGRLGDIGYQMYSSPDDHWYSRIPSTGQILKGTGHKSWPQTVAGETAAGNVITEGEDGMMYSNPPVTPVSSYENLILNNNELANIGAMTLDNIPTDRMLLPARFETAEQAAAEFDRLDSVNEPYPPVVYIANTGQYLDITTNPDLAPYVMGPEALKLYNANLLPKLKEINLRNKKARVNNELQQVNKELK
jgi:hypothetical protein|tara:strand:+ start:1396 stop:2559 length:1164 start_codon:yes stop_codon:yes gene_type:complete